MSSQVANDMKKANVGMKGWIAIVSLIYLVMGTILPILFARLWLFIAGEIKNNTKKPRKFRYHNLS